MSLLLVSMSAKLSSIKGSGILSSGIGETNAVSYTHLDVYKRQAGEVEHSPKGIITVTEICGFS